MATHHDSTKLYLLDAFALIFRAHFAFVARPLINTKGQNVSAITGFMNFLLEILNKENPSHIAVCFDMPGGTFRNDLYPAYKANRDATPEDIISATPYIKRILVAMNIPVLEVQGFEADDVIGTIAHKAADEGHEVFMVTPDKDYGQLVRDGVWMMKPARSGNEVEIWGEREVLENWGIMRVEQVVDCLGLQGDAVDNIPGVPSIGPKTAQKLLAQYGTVEGILAHTDELNPKQKALFETHREQALLSKTLARIDTNVPIAFSAEDCLITDFDTDTLEEIFGELEFRNVSKRVEEFRRRHFDTPNKTHSSFGTAGGTQPSADNSAQPSASGSHNPKQRRDTAGQVDLFGNSGSDVPLAATNNIAPNNITNTAHTYHLVDTAEARANLLTILGAQPRICFDTETTGIDANEAELVGMSFSIQRGIAYYVPVPTDATAARALVAEFKTLFEDANIAKIGQNIKYDMLMLRWYGVYVQGTLWDTMIMHYLLEPDLRHGMNYLAESYLQYAPVKIETLIGTGAKQKTMRDAPLEAVKEYAAEDADVTLQLFDYLYEWLEREAMTAFYLKVEMPLVPVIVAMEYEGIRIDSHFLNDYSKRLQTEIVSVRSEVWKLAAQEFNLDSPKQVGELLFDKMKLPYKGRKTKTGQYVTDEDKLTELAAEHPIARLILDYRGLTKLKSTYVDALPLQVNPKTGRVHTSYNQALAATGRLSSQNPNLQNIPIKTDNGKLVRGAFIPRSEAYTLLSADYSQVELRLIADLANETAMLEAFANGIDIHRATAAKIYNIPLEDVTGEQRRNAKTCNFSILYGAGAVNVSQQLGISRTEAKKLIDDYFAAYAGLKTYMQGIVEQARETGFVNTLLGRKRYLRDIHSQNGAVRSGAERTAINSPIQGSAADLIKLAMVGIQAHIEANGWQSRMLLQVHDELVFDVYLPELDALRSVIENCMQTAMPELKVKLEIGIGTGESWLAAH